MTGKSIILSECILPSQDCITTIGCNKFCENKRHPFTKKHLPGRSRRPSIQDAETEMKNDWHELPM